MDENEMMVGFKQAQVALGNRSIDIIMSGGDIASQWMLDSHSATPDSNEHRNGIGILQPPPEDWLPITQSRKGNSWTATFHLLCSGIGIQTLSLPLAFVYLGWFWGSVCLSVAYLWQLYTIGLLISLHESVPGTRYSRYLQLSMAAFEAVESEVGRIRSIFYALGIVALSFRGHNVVLEIQGTLPSTPYRTSSNLMWKGVIASYLIIAMCFFPLAIVGYWAFGNKIPTNGGMLTALSTTLYHHASKPVLGLIYVQVVISCLAAFQIYSMVVYDNLERAYASRTSQKCPNVTRAGIKIFFGGLTFFISVAFPFLPSLAMFIGGVALPLTFGYPCLMWIVIKRPRPKSRRWWVNLGLGCLGIGLSVVVVVGGVWNLAYTGLDANFFHPR